MPTEMMQERGAMSDNEGVAESVAMQRKRSSRRIKLKGMLRPSLRRKSVSLHGIDTNALLMRNFAGEENGPPSPGSPTSSDYAPGNGEYTRNGELLNRSGELYRGDSFGGIDTASSPTKSANSVPGTPTSGGGGTSMTVVTDRSPAKSTSACDLISVEVVPPVVGQRVKLSRQRRFRDWITGKGYRRRKRERRMALRALNGSDDKLCERADNNDSCSDSDVSVSERHIGKPPVVGASYLPGGVDDACWNTWRQGDAANTCVRTKGYTRTKIKEPSLPALYTLAACDCFHSPYKIDDMKSYVQGLDSHASAPTAHPDIPALLIVNVQMPNMSPPMKAAGNGPTIHVTLYFTASDPLREWARQLALTEDTTGTQSLLDAEIPPSVRLLAEWCRESETNGEIRGRFKIIGDVRNADVVGLPSFCKKFNGKPILVYAKESSFRRDTVRGIAELDCNGHNFSFLGRQALWATYTSWAGADLQVGVLLEGREDSELPEHLLGAAFFHGLDLSGTDHLAFAPDGTLRVGDEEDIAMVEERRERRAHTKSSSNIPPPRPDSTRSKRERLGGAFGPQRSSSSRGIIPGGICGTLLYSLLLLAIGFTLGRTASTVPYMCNGYMEGVGSSSGIFQKIRAKVNPMYPVCRFLNGFATPT